MKIKVNIIMTNNNMIRGDITPCSFMGKSLSLYETFKEKGDIFEVEDVRIEYNMDGIENEVNFIKKIIIAKKDISFIYEHKE